MENDRIPENDKQRAIFFRIPTPKSAPGLIGPDPAEYRACETEEGSETDDAIDHFRKRFANLDLASSVCDLRFRGGASDFSWSKLLSQDRSEHSDYNIDNCEQ